MRWGGSVVPTAGQHPAEAVSGVVAGADGLVDVHQGRVVQRLAEALRDGRQVELIRYQSPNSNTIADRLVEPLSFSDDYATLNIF